MLPAMQDGGIHNPSVTVALALVDGTLAQALGRQLGMPSIVLLLVAGVLLGPEFADAIRPAVLGALTEGFAAERAGLRSGDRVLELDGQPVDRFSQLVEVVRDRPGKSVTVVVDRGGEELTLDHVIPRAQGGKSRWDNCVLACLECNKRKADRTPEQAKMRLKHKPVQPKWNPLYVSDDLRIECWSKFLSEAYWNVKLET